MDYAALTLPSPLATSSTSTSPSPYFISLFEDDDLRWDAVRTRNPRADGFFVYAVRTTKIFCRPICKARLARRANVRFFATGQGALDAGFRACKRCKPELEGFMPEERAVQQIRAFVRQRAAGGPPAATEDQASLSLSQMARQTGLSKWHFHRVFKKCVGMTPVEFLKLEREAARSSGALATGQIAEGPSWELDGSLVHLPEFAQGFTFGEPALETSPSGFESYLSPVSLDDILSWPENLEYQPD